MNTSAHLYREYSDEHDTTPQHVGIGEPAYGEYAPGYVPQDTTTTTAVPSPLPADTAPDLAATGGDTLSAAWLAITLCAVGATLIVVRFIRKGRAS